MTYQIEHFFILEAFTVTTDPALVLVEEGLCSRCFVPTKALHHCHFPEIRTESGSLIERARHLSNRLALYREGAQSAWHREELDFALADVAEFLKSLRADPQTQVHCQCAPRAAKVAEPSVPGG
jgi:hypothetical protein